MLKRARILVIDDDPLFRSLIVSLLRKQYYVSVASNGSEGFYKALEQPPELAIIDIQMPVWDGLKTLRAFRSHPSLHMVKTMILSGDANKDTVFTAIGEGANGYIIKSRFSKAEFLEKVSSLLNGTTGVQIAAPPVSQPMTAATNLSVGNGRSDFPSRSH